MSKIAWLLALVIGWSFVACGQDDEKTCDLTGNDRTFGQCCTDNTQCTSGVCHEFGDGTRACTQACASDSECPDGSQGKKCNAQGVCRP